MDKNGYNYRNIKNQKEALKLQRKNPPLFIYITIVVAVIGFLSAMITDTSGLIKSILTSLLVGGLLFGAIYLLFIRKRRSDELTKYRKAVKQSKRKYQTDPQKSAANANYKFTTIKRSVTSTRKSAPHLRVIEGNKGKKKNRASL